MGRIDLFLAHVLDTPWAVLPSRGRVLLSVLMRRASGVSASWEEQLLVADSRARYEGRARSDARMSRGGIAVIPVHGVLTHRAHEVANASGGGLVAAESIADAFRRAAADSDVGTIVLDIDSPGGSVYGTQELGDLIAAAEKPVVGVANAEACSGAYWLLTQCDRAAVTPSGSVGSVGVYALHEDLSKMLEQEGVVPTLVTAGKFKTEGNSFGPLSDEGRDAWQARVDGYYDAFVKAVARGRGVTPAAVRGGFGEGRSVTARQALAAGMVDAVATLEDEVARIASGGRVKKRTTSAEIQDPAPRAAVLDVVREPAPATGAMSIDEVRAAAVAEAGDKTPPSDVDLRARRLRNL